MDILAFQAALLAGDSTTSCLERLFGAPVTMMDLVETDHQPDAALRHHLRVTGLERVRQRRARLSVGGVAIAHTSLCYLPARLPAERVKALRNNSAPFGRLMQGLGLCRTFIESRIGATGDDTILDNRALIRLPSGEPVAEVHEAFQTGQWLARLGTRQAGVAAPLTRD